MNLSTKKPLVSEATAEAADYVAARPIKKNVILVESRVLRRLVEDSPMGEFFPRAGKGYESRIRCPFN